MGRVRNAVFCSLLLAGFSGPANLCLGSGKSPPEFGAINNIAGGVTLRLETNSNASLSWQQVAQYVDITKLNRQLSRPGKIFVLQEHYVFITNTWVISELRNQQAILVRNQPRTSYEGRIGRYLVCWNGSFAQTLSISEDDFQKRLKESGVILPLPDSEEVAAAKAAVERLIAREEVEHEMLRQAAPKLSGAEIAELWWLRIKSWFLAYDENGHFTGRPRLLGVLAGLGVVGLTVYGWRWLRTNDSKRKVN